MHFRWSVRPLTESQKVTAYLALVPTARVQPAVVGRSWPRGRLATASSLMWQQHRAEAAVAAESATNQRQTNPVWRQR